MNSRGSSLLGAQSIIAKNTVIEQHTSNQPFEDYKRFLNFFNFFEYFFDYYLHLFLNYHEKFRYIHNLVLFMLLKMLLISR